MGKSDERREKERVVGSATPLLEIWNEGEVSAERNGRRNWKEDERRGSEKCEGK